MSKPLLLDIAACTCTDHVLEVMAKSMAEQATGDAIWAPHHDPYVSRHIEQVTGRLLRLNQAMRDVFEGIARRGEPGGAPMLKAQPWVRMDDVTLARAVRDTEVFARASPEHKLRLVAALQANGEAVAMTGDGVTDAPALKRADVGVAMGQKGTEAAKEAAEIVLADDNFASIAAAVEEGRAIYDNIRKAIVFILPTNGGQAAVLLAAIALGLAQLPITPAQILWVNMVTAVTLALALGFEPAEPDIMRRPPRRPDEPLLSPFMAWRVVFVSALMVAGGLSIFLWTQARGADLDTARTATVNLLLMGELFYLFNCRRLTASVLSWHGLTGNRTVLVAIAVLAVLQAGFTYLPVMQHLFRTAPLDAPTWALIGLFGLAVFLVVELEKALIVRRTAKSA